MNGRRFWVEGGGENLEEKIWTEAPGWPAWRFQVLGQGLGTRIKIKIKTLN